LSIAAEAALTKRKQNDQLKEKKTAPLTKKNTHKTQDHRQKHSALRKHMYSRTPRHMNILPPLANSTSRAEKQSLPSALDSSTCSRQFYGEASYLPPLSTISHLKKPQHTKPA